MKRRSLKEAAAELSQSPPALKRFVLERGLYELLPGSNRLRINEAQFIELQKAIEGKAYPSIPIRGRAVNYRYRDRSSHLAEALELCRQKKEESAALSLRKRQLRRNASAATKKG